MERYELDLPSGGKVSGCLIKGLVRDPRKAVSAQMNVLNAPTPQFSKDYVPESPEYQSAGYRPVSTGTVSAVQGQSSSTE